MKRLAIINDLHSGHIAGLTPPKFQTSDLQEKTWNFYSETIKKIQPIDILVCNGDAVEGRGEKSGGTELITTDRNIQVNMAKECIELANASKIYVVNGTPYHVGDKEDWEQILAEKLETEAHGHLWIDVNGLIFDFKHFIGASSIPHGRYTALARANMWNLYWNEISGAPRSNIFVRAHTHYFDFLGNDTYFAVVAPGLQSFGSKYGVRKCEGIIKIGLCWFDIYEDKKYNFDYSIMKVNDIAPRVIKV